MWLYYFIELWWRGRPENASPRAGRTHWLYMFLTISRHSRMQSLPAAHKLGRDCTGRGHDRHENKIHTTRICTGRFGRYGCRSFLVRSSGGGSIRESAGGSESDPPPGDGAACDQPRQSVARIHAVFAAARRRHCVSDRSRWQGGAHMEDGVTSRLERLSYR